MLPVCCRWRRRRSLCFVVHDIMPLSRLDIRILLASNTVAPKACLCTDKHHLADVAPEIERTYLKRAKSIKYSRKKQGGERRENQEQNH
jgi:hypothetical protein